MRADVKQELQFLRECGWILLPELRCWFCREAIVIRPKDMTFGHRRHPRLYAELTWHHLDHDRNNNERFNLKPAHATCHRSYHMKRRQDEKAEEGKETPEEGLLGEGVTP